MPIKQNSNPKIMIAMLNQPNTDKGATLTTRADTIISKAIIAAIIYKI